MILETLKARQSFAEIAALDEEALSLDRAALVMALEEYPELDIAKYLRKNRHARRARRGAYRNRPHRRSMSSKVSMKPSSSRRELRGNTDDYYDPRNSYLNEVLDRKLGIPISLSVLYMEVAKRIGFSVRGVGFPGHFLVKHVAGEKEIIVDPFNLGRILTWNDCQELLDKIYKDTVTMNASLLQPMEKRTILTRMLFNLKSIYTQKEQYFKALSVIDKILMLNPGTPSELRDRGLIYMQTSLFAKALADLETYLDSRLSRTTAPTSRTTLKCSAASSARQQLTAVESLRSFGVVAELDDQEPYAEGNSGNSKVIAGSREHAGAQGKDLVPEDVPAQIETAAIHPHCQDRRGCRRQGSKTAFLIRSLEVLPRSTSAQIHAGRSRKTIAQ